MSKIKLITPENAKNLIDAGKAILIDVRTTGEVVASSIPHFEYVPVPLATETRLETYVQHGKSLILYCQTGSRSDKLVDRFSELNNGDIWSLDGGIVAWQKEGLPTETTSRVISIERQTQIIVGTLIALSVFLGVTVDKGFLGATAFFGAGLLFAGLSGSCMMGILLGMLPWNR